MCWKRGFRPFAGESFFIVTEKGEPCIFMKKIFFSLILSLLCFAALALPAFADNSYSIEKVDYDVELRTDGSALVTESWDVTFNGESDGFVREIVIPVEEFESFADIKDLSVSVDGNGCSEVAFVHQIAGQVNGVFCCVAGEQFFETDFNIGIAVGFNFDCECAHGQQTDNQGQSQEPGN